MQADNQFVWGVCLAFPAVLREAASNVKSHYVTNKLQSAEKPSRGSYSIVCV